MCGGVCACVCACVCVCLCERVSTNQTTEKLVAKIVSSGREKKSKLILIGVAAQVVAGRESSKHAQNTVFSQGSK